jgi:hypothetical protein
VSPDVNSEVHDTGDLHERVAEPPTCEMLLQIAHSVGAGMPKAGVVRIAAESDRRNLEAGVEHKGLNR